MGGRVACAHALRHHELVPALTQHRRHAGARPAALFAGGSRPPLTAAGAGALDLRLGTGFPPETARRRAAHLRPNNRPPPIFHGCRGEAETPTVRSLLAGRTRLDTFGHFRDAFGGLSAARSGARRFASMTSSIGRRKVGSH
eukprot:1177597-Prorocentrum_minimum.AAC.9